MNIVYFTHSLLSCWNHGNAHFLRGVLRELGGRGHSVTSWEPIKSWSLANLIVDHGEAGLSAFRQAYPDLAAHRYYPDEDISAVCQEADLVIVHEWNDPALVKAVGRARRHANFTLLFHDTHHRAVSDPSAIHAFDLEEYDGVLAFGRTLAEVYRKWGWGERAFVWHEAADTTLFKPPLKESARCGLVWIGNWGDGERTTELEDFLMAPARAAGLELDIYGVRYPDAARAMLADYGVRYRGWLANVLAPRVFARHLATVHVPRRQYAGILPGIPTIRMFEALACGIPLISAPWDDAECLFRKDRDFLYASDGEAMRRHLQDVTSDPALRASLVGSGIETILRRHTCAHRVDELLQIASRLGRSVAAETR